MQETGAVIPRNKTGRRRAEQIKSTGGFGRAAFAAHKPAVAVRRLVLELDACTLARDSGETIALTRGEFSLLRMFVGRGG